MALARDAVLRAYRLSDPFIGSAASIAAASEGLRNTLCGVAALLSDSSLVARLETAEWACDLGYLPAMATGAAKRNMERIARFQGLLVADWSKRQPPERELVELRECLRPLRDRVLAHAIDDVRFAHPSVDQIRLFMTLILELSTDMAFLFTGSAVGAGDFKEHASEQAARLWDYAFRASIEQCRDDIQARADAGIAET